MRLRLAETQTTHSTLRHATTTIFSTRIMVSTQRSWLVVLAVLGNLAPRQGVNRQTGWRTAPALPKIPTAEIFASWPPQEGTRTMATVPSAQERKKPLSSFPFLLL